MRAALTALVALLVVSLFPASAGAKLPVGSADGVRIVRERGAIVAVFTPAAQRLWRRVRGRVASVMCWEREIPDETGLFAVTSGGGGSLRAPKRSRRLRTGDHTRGMDYCRVWLEPRTVARRGARVRLGRRLVVSIPLTQRGAVYLDEQSKALELRNVLLAASFAGDDTFPTRPSFATSSSAAEGVGERWRFRARTRLPRPALSATTATAVSERPQ